MRTAEEIIHLFDSNMTRQEDVSLINQIQLELRNEVVEEIADFVKEMVEWGESPESVRNAILDFKK